MNEALIEAIKQVPALGVLAWIVYIGVTRMQTIANSVLKSQEKRDIAFTTSLKTTADECHNIQKMSIEAMKDNTRVLGGVVAVLKETHHDGS